MPQSELCGIFDRGLLLLVCMGLTALVFFLVAIMARRATHMVLVLACCVLAFLSGAALGFFQGCTGLRKAETNAAEQCRGDD